MNWFIFPSLLAAALSLNPNAKNVSPGLGSRIVIRTEALLGSSDPGEYEVGDKQYFLTQTSGHVLTNDTNRLWQNPKLHLYCFDAARFDTPESLTLHFDTNVPF